jgi:hypothetical protein
VQTSPQLTYSPKELLNIDKVARHTTQQLFDTIKTGIHWKWLPERTFTSNKRTVNVQGSEVFMDLLQQRMQSQV